MTPFAIELDGRTISAARDGRVLHSVPMAGKGPASQPLSSELLRNLAGHGPGDGESVWIATSARYDASDLGALLDAARVSGLAVSGFVDAAAVSVSALPLERDALVLEIGVQHVAVTAVELGAQARRRRSIVSTRGGLFDLNEAWLRLISTAMVKRTRFDPLMNAATEQQLRAALPGMLLELGNGTSTAARVEADGNQFEIVLSRDQFVSTAEPVCREALRQLHELRPAGASVALVTSAATAALPGLRAMLQQFIGCELVTTADGFAAAATSVLDLPPPEGDRAVRLLRRLPSSPQAELAHLVSREPLGEARAAGPAASHVLFADKAHALSGTLTIGRSSDAGAAIALPEGLAGVSRRHCTLVSEGGELVLIDHSRFGTFLNGERVSERARVYAGDRIRIGDPGMELSLISLG
jgi:hypothetical protein